MLELGEGGGVEPLGVDHLRGAREDGGQVGALVALARATARPVARPASAS